MPYQLRPGVMYRMPTHFGPSLGPRQGPDGRRFACRDTPRMTTWAVNFLTRREQLEGLLPERFEVGAEPVVTVAVTYITEIEWLAGRGYNVLGVTFPAVFRGEHDRAEGPFLSVFWENLTDPIVTGREELGFSKIYCEIPEPRILDGEARVTASWLGFPFLDIVLGNLVPAPPSPTPVGNGGGETLRGTLHYKYIPRTQDWGAADASYAVLTPESTPNKRILESWSGDGSVQFHRARWEDMPTQSHIVNALADLEILECRGAVMFRSVGDKDLSDQRILR